MRYNHNDNFNINNNNYHSLAGNELDGDLGTTRRCDFDNRFPPLFTNTLNEFHKINVNIYFTLLLFRRRRQLLSNNMLFSNVTIYNNQTVHTSLAYILLLYSITYHNLLLLVIFVDLWAFIMI